MITKIVFVRYNKPMTPEDQKYVDQKIAEARDQFKKLTDGYIEESKRHMGVLNEHFKSQVVGVAEQYTSLKDSTNERFDKVDERFDSVEQKQDITNEKLDEVIEILHANQETLIEHDRVVEELQKTR